jgi:D-3-phosphoglycerate dehydrogenase
MPRIAILHKNVPNVIGTITGLISAEGLNIENMTNQSRGAYAYTVIDVGSRPSNELIEKLEQVENHYRVRLLMP